MEAIYSNVRGKVWDEGICLCDAESGYIWNNICADTDVVDDYEYNDSNVFMTLMNDLLDEGPCVILRTGIHQLNYVTNYVKD